MKYANELKVGIAIVLSILVMVLGVRFFQNLPLFQGSYTLYTAFEDAGGLSEGGAVRMKGFQVGTVGEMRLDHATQKVRVVLKINRDVPVPEGSRARVGGVTALSNVYVEILPGPPDRPPLPDGAELPAEETPDVLGMLMERSGPMLMRADSLLGHLNRVSGALETMLRSPDGEVRATLSGLQQTVALLEDMLRSERRRVRQVLTHLETTTRTLAEFSQQQGDSLALALRQTHRVLTTMERTLQQAHDLGEELTEVARQLNEGEGTLGRLLQDETLYVRLDSLVLNMRSLVQDIQANPERYLKISVF